MSESAADNSESREKSDCATLRNERKARALSHLFEVTQSLLRLDDLGEVLRSIAQNAVRALDADVVVVYEYLNEDFRIPPVVAGTLLDAQVLREKGAAIPHRESVVFQMIKRQTPFYASSPQEWTDAGFIFHSNTGYFLQREKVVSSVGVPLFHDQSAVGLLFINYRTHRAFTSLDRELIEIYSNQAALAIHNARTHKDLESHAQNLLVLSEISRALSAASSGDATEVLQVIYKQAGKMLDVNNFFIALYDDTSKELALSFLVDQGSVVRTDLNSEFRSNAKKLADHVIKYRTSVLIERDLPNWFRTHGLDVTSKIPRSLVCVPLIVKETVIGVISIQSFETYNAFNSYDMQLLEAIASQAAIAIEKAQIYRYLRRQTSELEALHRTSLSIGSKAEITSRLIAIVQAAAELLGASGGRVYFKIPNQRRLRLMATTGVDRELYPVGSTIEFGQGLTGRVVESGKPIIVNDYSRWPGHIPALAPLFGAAIEVPLKLENEAIGVLAVFADKEERVFSSEDIPLLERFATHASLAIRDSKLLEESEARVRDLEIVNKVVQRINSKLSIKELLSEIVHEVQEHLKCTHCTVFLELDDTKGRHLVPRASSGKSAESLMDRDFAVNEGFLGTVFLKGEPFLADDAGGLIEGYKTARSLLVVPVKVDETNIGVISVDKDEKGWFDKNHERLLVTLAQHIGIAIERARLFEKIKGERETQIEAVREITRSIANWDNLDDVLDNILRWGLSLMGEAAVGDIRVVDFNRDEFLVINAITATGDRLPREHQRFPLAGSFTGEVVRDRSPVVIPDVTQDQRYTPATEGIRSEIVVPMLREKELVGVLNIEHEEAGAFSELDVKLAQAIAGLAVVAIETARLLEKLGKQVVELKNFRVEQAKTFEDFNHQLKSPIFQLYRRTQLCVRKHLSGDRNLDGLQRDLLILRSLAAKARGVSVSLGLFASLARGQPIRLERKSLGADALVRELIEQIEDQRIIMDPAREIKLEVLQDGFEVLRDNLVSVDYGLLLQAISNLLDNASKYSYPRTTVKIRGGLTKRGRFFISIVNSGLPLKRDYLGHLIERGWRGPEARVVTGGGSGIGLWLVHNIMLAHGGELVAIPTDAQNRTEFKLIFPVGSKR